MSAIFEADMDKSTDTVHGISNRSRTFVVFMATFCSNMLYHISDSIFVNIDAQNTLKHHNWVPIIRNDILIWKYLSLNFAEI